jgi:hypothetical protein
MDRLRLQRTTVWTATAALLASGTLGSLCDKPDTRVVIDNQYPSSTPGAGAVANVIYQAAYKETSFQDPILPGASSDPAAVVAASSNTAYVLLAPGWDPDAGTAPDALVVMQSKDGFAVHLDTTLRIPVDDTTFGGNCAAGSHLTQAQADLITQRVFPDVFAGVAYDPATCATRPISDASAD